MIFYNYCLTRSDKKDPFYPELDQPFWFGKGKKNRIYDHRRHAKKCQKDPTLPRDIRIKIIIKLWEQGLNFKEEVICMKLSERESFEIEKSLISKYGRIDIGTGCLANLTDGGEGGCGWVPSEEARRKMGESKTGERNPNYGVPMPEKNKRMMSRIHKGKIISEEHKNRISEANKRKTPWNLGMIMPEEYKEKFRKPMPDNIKQKISESMMGENNHFSGKHHTEEVKERISKANKGNISPMKDKHHTEEAKERLRIANKGKSPPNKGNPMSDEQKRKIKQTWENKKWLMTFLAIAYFISELLLKHPLQPHVSPTTE